MTQLSSRWQKSSPRWIELSNGCWSDQIISPDSTGHPTTSQPAKCYHNPPRRRIFFPLSSARVLNLEYLEIALHSLEFTLLRHREHFPISSYDWEHHENEAEAPRRPSKLLVAALLSIINERKSRISGHKQGPTLLKCYDWKSSISCQIPL